MLKHSVLDLPNVMQHTLQQTFKPKPSWQLNNDSHLIAMLPWRKQLLCVNVMPVLERKPWLSQLTQQHGLRDLAEFNQTLLQPPL
jgi:hypothetical protein